jgi:tRNA nucleotidyltransferase (CCA-adding enzyme)
VPDPAAPAGLFAPLPADTVALLHRLGEMARGRGMEAYLVGGLVRDLFLGVGSIDLDIAVVGDGIAFARRAGGELGGGIAVYDRFRTATITMPDLTRVDVATSRSETYERPGALPDVKPAPIAADLVRRDFTINALAVDLDPDKFGVLVDPHGGAADLAAHRLRVLHDRSFLDDPTRIIRLARFAARFDFVAEPHTRELLEAALESRVLDFLSADRLRQDLYLAFDEPDPGAVFGFLADSGALSAILPGAAPGGEFPVLFDRAHGLVSFVEKGSQWDPSALYLLLLLRDAVPEDLVAVVRRLGLGAGARIAVESAPVLKDLVKKAEAAEKASVLRGLLAGRPLEIQLAVAVMAETEKSRRALIAHISHGRLLKPELTGDDLIIMGFNPGPGIGRILGELTDAKLDGTVETLEDEEKFVASRFVPPKGEPAEG